MTNMRKFHDLLNIRYQLKKIVLKENLHMESTLFYFGFRLLVSSVYGSQMGWFFVIL